MTGAVLVALIGLGAGVLGSLVATWAQWGVEQKRERLAHRRALVRSWREGVAEFARESTDLDPPHPTEYLDRDWYLSLRPRLAEEPQTWDPSALGDEIAWIEKTWGLA